MQQNNESYVFSAFMYTLIKFRSSSVFDKDNGLHSLNLSL